MRQKWVVPLCLLILSISIRLPYYFEGVINWDESTFILVAQSLLNGHLPYTELWDIKPPLLSVAYAMFIVLFGKSVIAVRFAGSLCIFLTSWFVYSIAKKLGDNSVGILAGVLSIITASTLTVDAQATLSEHVAIVPLFAGLTMLILFGTSPKNLFWGGLLLTVATMIRLNLAYTVVAIGLWLVYMCFRSKAVNLQGIAAYCLGSFSIIFLTYFPYLITGNSGIWWNSVILAPLSYSSSRVNFDLLLRVGLAFAIAVGLWKALKSDRQQEFMLLQVACLGTAISMIQGGEFHKHYFLQIFPFLALTIALFWRKLPSTALRLIAIACFALALSSYVPPILDRYYTVGDRSIAGQPLSDDTVYEISKYFKQHNPENKPIYLMRDHLVYWFNDLKPPSKAVTHPSNLAKEYLFPYIKGAGLTTEAELAKILAQQPEFILTRSFMSYVEENPEANLLLKETLSDKYELVKKIGCCKLKNISLIYQLK